MSFGTNLELAGEVVKAVRHATQLPLITKLSPNVNNIAEFAKCVVANGSDMISLINTYPSLAIDIHSRTPKIATGFGGLSGPGIKPIAVKMVYETARAVEVPVIGMGGIYSADDAIEFFLAGATAVAIGTAIFTDPKIPLEVVAGIEKYLIQHKLADIREIIGAIQVSC